MQRPIPECSVIIPVYNKWELTRACLASLREHTAAHALEVIVVDNGSSDATATELAPYGTSLFGEGFTAIVFPENRNFAPACNAGAHAAASPVLFFLNNDTLMTPHWLPPLLEALRVGGPSTAVGPLLLYENGCVQHLGVAYGTHGPCHLYQDFPASHPVVSRKRKLQAITGAALMIGSDFFRECGEFYEEYRNGYEDLELCVQIRRHGGTVRCVPASRVYHLESQTPGRQDAEDKNAALFDRRCGGDVFIDMHHHALRDDFAVAMNDLLRIDSKLKEKDEDVIIQMAQGLETGTLLRLTQEHPLWIRGRELLAQSFEAQKLYAQAAFFRLQLVEIEHTVSRYQDLLRLAPLIETPFWLPRVEGQMAKSTHLQTDQAFALRTARYIRQHFGSGGDPLLEQMLDAKLREWFPSV